MQNSRDPFSGITLFFQLSTLVLGATFGSLLIGLWFDRTFGSAPFGTMCLVILGLFAGTVAVYRVVNDTYKGIGGRRR